MTRAPCVVALVLAGCAAADPQPDRDRVVAQLIERTGHGPRPSAQGTDDDATLPPGVAVSDGLTLDECVATALWNNLAFRADLAELGVARAEVCAAGALANPVLSFLFPVGPKQAEAAISWSLDGLLKRPGRIAAAELDLEQVAARLVDHGLALAHDVAVAYWRAASAADVALLAARDVELRERWLALALAAARAGATSGTAIDRARLAVARSASELAAARAAVHVADQRLVDLLGLPFGEAPRLAREDEGAPELAPLDALLADASAARPDLRAAELAVEAAGERVGLARLDALRFAAIWDVNAPSDGGTEAGPGISAEIPIFDFATGQRARADAQLELAARRLAAARRRIEANVRDAHERAGGTLAVLHSRRDDALRVATGARDRSARGHAAGAVNALELVEAELALVGEARAVADAELAAREACARVELAVGRRESPRAEQAP